MRAGDAFFLPGRPRPATKRAVTVVMLLSSTGETLVRSLWCFGPTIRKSCSCMDEIDPRVRGWAQAANLEALLCDWQTTASHESLEQLIRLATPGVLLVVGRVLRQHGIRDPDAVDDAVALVLNHLRRLPGGAEGDPAVARFDPARSAAADNGRSYLHTLAHDRALDVARRRGREGRRMATFSSLDGVDGTAISTRISITDDEPGESRDPAYGLLHEAVSGLQPRERALVRLLLEGKSQAVIAHVLGVCAGTVSRIRVRAIAKLRRAIQTRSSGGHGETPAPPARAARPGRARASPRRGPPGPSAPV